MKIAHVVSTYPPYYGGMGNVVFQTASGLVELGHEVEVFTPGVYEEKEIKVRKKPVEAEHEPELQQRVDFARRLRPTLHYGNAARIPQVQKELKEFDVVHLHYPFFGMANMIRRWKIQNPYNALAVTYHMDTRAPGWKGLLFKYYAKYWMPKILRSADMLIGSSLDYIKASDARTIYEENKQKWVELPFGVDVNRFKPREKKPEALFERHGLDIDRPTIIFVGGMDAAHYFKGVTVLLKALVVVRGQNLPLQAVLVGEGDLRPSFENKAAFYGVSEAVRFVGRISDEELPYYYNMADLLVLPSINRGEAFGMVLLEAMASGVPVLASDLPGVRTVASDGGMLVASDNYQELAEAMKKFFSKATDQKKWSLRVREVAEQKYSWQVIVKRLEDIYKELVGQ